MIEADSRSELSTALRHACHEARLWLGATSPNPPVGAVALDAQGHILAVAAHKKAGSDHAESALINICRTQDLLPQVATLVVTLEPCNHTGKTPPCCRAILEAGIRRVVVGTRDPNPHVEGGGCEELRRAGIDVIEGIETESCRRLIHAFAYAVANKKPFVTVKRAFDEQGSMIPMKGQKTFTSKNSLILAHRLRKKADAIVTGSGTLLADAPLFTVRYVPDHEGKRRVLGILDRRGRVSKEYIKEAEQRGFNAIVYQSLEKCFEDLSARGVQDALVEAGPTLTQAILNSEYWDMKIDLSKREGAEDKTELAFRDSASLPFDANGLSIEDLLPLEK